MLELTHAARADRTACCSSVGAESDATAASVELMDGNGNVRLSIPDSRDLRSIRVEPDVAPSRRHSDAGAPGTRAARPGRTCRALDFLASTLRLCRRAEQDELSEKLFGIREALRSGFRSSASGDDEPGDPGGPHHGRGRALVLRGGLAR